MTKKVDYDEIQSLGSSLESNEITSRLRKAYEVIHTLRNLDQKESDLSYGRKDYLKRLTSIVNNMVTFLYSKNVKPCGILRDSALGIFVHALIKAVTDVTLGLFVPYLTPRELYYAFNNNSNCTIGASIFGYTMFKAADLYEKIPVTNMTDKVRYLRFNAAKDVEYARERGFYIHLDEYENHLEEYLKLTYPVEQ